MSPPVSSRLSTELAPRQLCGVPPTQISKESNGFLPSCTGVAETSPSQSYTCTATQPTRVLCFSRTAIQLPVRLRVLATVSRSPSMAFSALNPWAFMLELMAMLNASARRSELRGGRGGAGDGGATGSGNAGGGGTGGELGVGGTAGGHTGGNAGGGNGDSVGDGC